MKQKKERLVVPSVTDEDPMTSKRVTRQPKKKRVAGIVDRLKRRAKE